MNETNLFSRIGNTLLLRISLAIVTTTAALAIGHLFEPLWGEHVPYIVALVAISFCAWYCGLVPATLASVLGTVALKYWFVSPVQTFTFASSGQFLGLLVFLATCALMITMAELHRRKNEKLRISQGQLEKRVHERTVELDIANQGLRELTARLMQLQDDERRRIARELHDSVGQMLAALSMNLTTVGADIERLQYVARTIADSAVIVREMSQEVRTISYLLHPPLLDERGLASALRWYVEGFSERSKLEVKLEISEAFGRLPQETETAIFRTVQECLTNIHRHSGSTIAKVRLRRSDHEVWLKIEDSGTGIPPEKLEEMVSAGTPGVGIRGMRERLRQLGGSLEIQSSEKGTTVEARLPVVVSITATSEIAA